MKKRIDPFAKRCATCRDVIAKGCGIKTDSDTFCSHDCKHSYEPANDDREGGFPDEASEMTQTEIYLYLK